MTDSDPGGPDLGRIPSPLDQRRLAEAREMERRAEAAAEAVEQPQPRLRTQVSGASRRLSRGSRNFTNEVQQLTRLLEEAQLETQQLREMLNLNGEQLVDEKTRIERLEERLRSADARYIAHDVARQKAEMESSRSGEDAKRYKVQLELALREIQKAQSEVDAADDERNKAEEAAARARDRERKLIEAIKVRDALDQGRAEGRQEGLREGIAQGMARGSAQGRREERQRALVAFQEWLDRRYPEGAPDGARGNDIQIERQRRPYDTVETRLQQADMPANNYYAQNPRGGNFSSGAASPPGGYYGGVPTTQPPSVPPPVTVGEPSAFRERAASVSRSPGPQLPPPPVVPDSAPMVQPAILQAMVSEQRLPQPLMASPSLNPSRPASRASRAGSRAHSPIRDLPDGFIPMLGENSRINLPPPHEVQPTRGVLMTEEPELPLDVPVDPTRSLSRQQSRMSMRSVNPIVHPSPQRVLDPANLFQSQPGVPSPQQQTIQPRHSISEIRGGRESDFNNNDGFGSGFPANEYGPGEFYNDRGPVSNGRLSRIEEGVERATPASLRYAAGRELPASVAPSVYARSGNGSIGGMDREGFESRERLRQELRNSDPNVVDELMSSRRSAPSETYSGRSSRPPFSNMRRPAQISVPAPLAPQSAGYPLPTRQEDDRSRMSGHSRSASVAAYPPLPPSSYGGNRRRTASVSTVAPTIVVQPPTPASQTPVQPRERNALPPDVPQAYNRPPSPARSTRSFAGQPIPPRATSRAASVRSRTSGYFRGNGAVDISGSALPPNGMPSTMEFQDDYEDRFGGGGPDPTAIPLPHSAAPSYARLPNEDARSQRDYQMGYQGAPTNRAPSRFTTPAAAQYSLPPSDDRTEFKRSPNLPYESLPNPYAPAPQPEYRSASRATMRSQAMTPTPPSRPRSRMAGAVPGYGDQPMQDAAWASGDFSANPRAPSRAQSMRPPGSALSMLPPLPPSGATAWGSPSEPEEPLPRPTSRASNMGPNGFVMPEVARSSKYYDAPMSPDQVAPQAYPRSASRMSMRSNATARPFAENEIDMANLATGGQSMLRNAPSTRSLKSALKQTPSRRNIEIEDEPELF